MAWLWLHNLSPKRCLSQNLIWKDNELRCPICGHLISYRFKFHGEYQVHICWPYCMMKGVKKMIENALSTEVELDDMDLAAQIDSAIDLLHQSDPYEPLMSDRWDDDEAYENDVKDYIEKQKEKECDIKNERSYEQYNDPSGG